VNAKYFLSQAGRELCPLDGSKAQCLAQVRYIAKQELKRAKAKYGDAYLHKLGDGSYSITLGSDRRSSLWTSVSLVSQS